MYPKWLQVVIKQCLLVLPKQCWIHTDLIPNPVFGGGPHTVDGSEIRLSACKTLLREPQHTLGAYPMNPQTTKWKEFLHKLLVGGCFGMFRGYVGKFLEPYETWELFLYQLVLAGFWKKHEQSFGAKVAMNMPKGLYGIFAYIQKFSWFFWKR